MNQLEENFKFGCCIINEHKICKKRADKMIGSGIPFSFDEIQNFILQDKKAILRISTGYSIGDYIIELENDGIINFDNSTKKYCLNKNTNGIYN
jgi:hypothetical protein